MGSRTGNYYHAGYYRGDDVVWSQHTRRSPQAAEREAVRMARRAGVARGVVEYWDRQHGLRPGDCNLVTGAYDVEVTRG